MTYADASSTRDTLDALGRSTEQTDEAAVSIHYAYDALGRLTSVTDALGNVTRYTYDETGNKLTQTDAEGRTTGWAYDALGRIARRTLPLGQSESFLYDVNGNRTSHTDFNGNTHTFEYDINDRMAQANYADGSVTTYGYDAVGNRTQSRIVDNNGTRTWQYSYDNRNRLSEETKPDGSTLDYQYDAAGNKSQLITSLSSGETETISYRYDALNRLASMTNTHGITTYGYDEVGNRSNISYPNGSSQTWIYDSRNRLTNTSIYNGSGTLIQSFDYTLHPTGRRTRIVELGGRVSSYTYNDLYWLRAETIIGGVDGNYNASYQYDTVGNRTLGVEAGVTTAYNYDDNDRLTQHGGITYVYDANGNTLSEDNEGTRTDFTYNSQNQLTEHTAAGINTQYQYNAEGIRHSQSELMATTDYLVDANRNYAQVLAESINGTLDVTYHYGDDLMCQSRDADAKYFHTDGLGSTRVLTDSMGQETDTYSYAAFGEVLDQTGVTENSYLFTGEQLDTNLDQYYLRARYYDQGVGRFTQMDTWMGDSVDPVTLHKYLYANIDPVNNIDPSGRFSLGAVTATIRVISSLATIGYVGYDLYQYGAGGKEPSASNLGWTAVALLSGPVVGKLASAAAIARYNRIVSQAIKSGNIGKLFLNGGKTNEALLRRFIPSGSQIPFKATDNIAAGFKYRFKVGTTKIEIKWHSPDLNAAKLHPGSNSGTMWTAQIKIGNKLLGTDGVLYRRPSNITHIPLEI